MFSRLRNNSWCKDPRYAAYYLYDLDEDEIEDLISIGETMTTIRTTNTTYRWRPTVPHPKAIRGVLCLFHYPTQSFLNINDEPFPIPPSLDDLMEEVTGTSVKGAIYSDPGAAYDYALELGERFKEGEEAILTSPKHAAEYAYWVLDRRWPRAEAVIATDGEAAAEYAIHVTEKRWTEFADTVTAQIAEGAISIDPGRSTYAKNSLADAETAEANMANDPMGCFYAPMSSRAASRETIATMEERIEYEIARGASNGVRSRCSTSGPSKAGTP